MKKEDFVVFEAKYLDNYTLYNPIVKYDVLFEQNLTSWNIIDDHWLLNQSGTSLLLEEVSFQDRKIIKRF